MRRLLVDTAPLRVSPAFRRLWTGRAVSGFGAQMTLVAVMYQVWQATGSTVWSGAVGLAQALPVVALGLPAGAVADRVDRRRLCLGSAFGQAACSALLAVQVLGTGFPVAAVLGLLAVQSSFGAFSGPASGAFLPQLLPRESLAAGLALNRIAFQAQMLLGPALGGIVIGVWGVGGCYLLDAVSFGAGLYGLFGLPAKPVAAAPAEEAATAVTTAGSATAVPTSAAVPTPLAVPTPAASPTAVADPAAEEAPAVDGPARPGLRGVADGLAFLARTPAVRGALLTDLAATVLSMPISLFPLVDTERFGGDPRTLGLFLSAIAVGGIAASVLSGSFTRLARPGTVMLAGSALWGVALACFGLSTRPWAALGCLVVAGAADTVAVVSRGTIVRLHTPDALLGRVGAAEQIVGQAGPDLGNMRGGLVASAWSGTAALVSGGLLCVAAVGAIAWGFRERSPRVALP
ncbi:MFS transporter [Actinacidiphila reveromycinica]|uniref:MFS transporter n=1 Tax=Actinacidiphila reveromycinica TaxID=659352 RepID=UPI00192162FE|nr:MFS transporter [Streptomyces sp. SN-593]